MRARYRLRRVVNLANGSTPGGLAVARLGGARLADLTDGGYRDRPLRWSRQMPA